MGFLDRLFRRDKPPAAVPREPAPGRGKRDESSGVPFTEEVVRQEPFPRRFRLRAVFADYDLYGSWKVVTLNSEADWPAAREEVFQAYYKQFGLIRLPDGSGAIRWNEDTWRGIRETLDILYDPRFAPAAALQESSTP